MPSSPCSGLNIMSREKLQYGLDNNYTVLALWNSENCVSCSNHIWEVYRAIYSFMDEKQVLFPPLLQCSSLSSRRRPGATRVSTSNTKSIRMKGAPHTVSLSRDPMSRCDASRRTSRRTEMIWYPSSSPFRAR